MWEAFITARYSQVGSARPSASASLRLHQQRSALQSRMPRGDGAFIRDSDLFWVPRTVGDRVDVRARSGMSPASTIRDTGLAFAGNGSAAADPLSARLSSTTGTWISAAAR